MKIRNNLQRNTSFFAQHAGNGIPPRIVIPAGATLELSDEEWVDFAEAAATAIEAGHLEVTVAPAESDEEVEAKRIAALQAAQKLLADHAASQKESEETK